MDLLERVDWYEPTRPREWRGNEPNRGQNPERKMGLGGVIVDRSL